MAYQMQSQRALLCISRPLSLSLAIPQSRTPQTWIRAITTKSKSQRQPPAISFGPDADIALAKYIKKPVKKTSEDVIEDNNDGGFEVQDFIDRSARSSPAAAETPTPSTQASKQKNKNLTTKDDTSSSSRPPRAKARHQKHKDQKDDSNPAAAAAVSTHSRSSETTTTPNSKKATPKPPRPEWALQKSALAAKFASAPWSPRKKLSPDAMDGIRGLHESDPIKHSTAVLAEQFKVSPEAIRRILRSKWLSRAGSDKMDEKRERFARRHDRIWDLQAELGLRPQRTREARVESEDKFESERERRRVLREI